jgi:hypothetical protein
MSNERLRIILDSTVLNADEYDGSAGAKLSIRQNNEGELITSFGSNLKLFGRGRSIIFNNIINAVNPYLASVSIFIYDMCCLDAQNQPIVLFEGIIKYGDIKWCEQTQDGTCELEVEFQDNSKTARQIQCLKSIFVNQRISPDGSISSAGEDEGRPSFYYDYYEETRPKSFMYIVLYLTMFLVNIITPFLIFLAIVTFGFFRPRRAIQAIYDKFLKRKLHKAPLVFSYLMNACKLCGLNLRSSLFQPGGIYHFLSRMDTATHEGGNDVAEADQIYDIYNAPLITPIELLQSFQDLNIGYSIDNINNLLVVERKDFFSGNTWIDFTGNRQQDVVSICYTFSKEQQPVGARYRHTNDQSDKTGSEAVRNWSGIADWNSPYSPLLQGIKNVTLQYGTSRFVDDELDSVIYNFSQSVLFQVNTFGGLLFTLDYIMIMATGTAYTPKLLMWDGQSARQAARVQKLQNPFGAGSQYNIPARLNVSAVNGNTFYHNLLKIDNPQINLLRNQSFELVCSYICSDIQNFGYGKSILFLKDGVITTGIVENVEIDLDTFQMTITGKI